MVEQAWGVLCQRFARWHAIIPWLPEDWKTKIPVCIEASMILHNLCIDAKVPLSGVAVPVAVESLPSSQVEEPPNSSEEVLRACLTRYAVDNYTPDAQGRLVRLHA